LPATTLTGARAALGELGTRPLGDALFAYAGLERGPIEIAATDEGWARRSVFRIEGAPLLVAEWFLPALEACSP
jgi:chorismate--pyruvate lyase